VFEWLHGRVERVLRAAIPMLGRVVDETWRPPAMLQAWHTATPLEVIRFAAANRLCVDLSYQGTRRLIEPYSLRRTREGNLLLFAVRHKPDEDRSYRIDRIQGAEVTKEPFTPKYVVELTPSGPISAPPTSRRSTGLGILRPWSVRTTSRRAVSRTRSFGPKYVFRCTACGKQFTRKSYSASLNPHKNKQGYPCPGSTGIYVTTKY
jgi:predicted DNA-binding transcriptional regulator YafY